MKIFNKTEGLSNQFYYNIVIENYVFFIPDNFKLYCTILPYGFIQHIINYNSNQLEIDQSTNEGCLIIHNLNSLIDIYIKDVSNYKTYNNYLNYKKKELISILDYMNINHGLTSEFHLEYRISRIIYEKKINIPFLNEKQFSIFKNFISPDLKFKNDELVEGFTYIINNTKEGIFLGKNKDKYYFYFYDLNYFNNSSIIKYPEVIRKITNKDNNLFGKDVYIFRDFEYDKLNIIYVVSPDLISKDDISNLNELDEDTEYDIVENKDVADLINKVIINSNILTSFRTKKEYIKFSKFYKFNIIKEIDYLNY